MCRRLRTGTSKTRCSRPAGRFSWISGRSGAGRASASDRPSTQLASDYAGKVTIGKLNVDDNPNTAFKFQIRGIPAVLLFKDGQVVETVVGLAPKEDFKRAIDKHII